MKFRKSTWCNLETGEAAFGIEAQLIPGKKWMTCCNGEEPLFYHDEAERDRKLKELRKTKS